MEEFMNWFKNEDYYNEICSICPKDEAGIFIPYSILFGFYVKFIMMELKKKDPEAALSLLNLRNFDECVERLTGVIYHNAIESETIKVQ